MDWTLADLPTAVIARVVAVDQPQRAALASHGLRPGVVVEVEDDAPFHGPRIVRLGFARSVSGASRPGNDQVAAMSAVRAADLACHRPTDAEATVVAGARESQPPTVAVIGRPNVGKSTFFARASGRYAEAANVPGTTVGVERRTVRLSGREAVLVDLPGALSLTDRSEGLPAFWQLIAATAPTAVLVIVDAGNLARHLPLALACRDLGVPIVVAANLADEAEARGIEVDLGRLSQLLAAPVYRTVGRRGDGVLPAVGEAVRLASDRAGAGRRTPRRAMPATPYSPDVVGRVRRLAAVLIRGGSFEPPPVSTTDRRYPEALTPLLSSTHVRFGSPTRESAEQGGGRKLNRQAPRLVVGSDE